MKKYDYTYNYFPTYRATSLFFRLVREKAQLLILYLVTYYY